MTINGVSTFSTACYSGTSVISEETRRQLIALGIDPSTVTSEAQAKQLIAAAKQKVAETTNDSSSKSTCSSELELLSRVKNFANKIGVKLSFTQTLKEMIDELTSKVQELKSTEDTAEFDGIKNEYAVIENSQNAMYTAMNVTANINKFMLGLK